MSLERKDKGVEDIGHQIGELRREMQAGFQELRGEIKDVNTRIDSVHASMQASFNTLWASMLASFIALLVAFLVTHG